MNRRMVANLIGRIMLIEVLAMIPPAGISLYHREWKSAVSFLATMALLAAGSAVLLLIKPKVKAFYASEGFMVTAISWIVISFFGSLPFFFSGAIPRFVDCIFETVSGFTTTGASILADVESLPMGILYWRSFTHWLGGMGVLVFLLAIVPSNGGEGYFLHLLRAESPGPDVGKLTPKIAQSAKLLYKIYIALSILEVILLLCGGMPLFDSLCTMFGTAGTGGFSIKNASMAAYPSPYLQIVVTVFMAVFGINFNIFYLLLLREFSRVLHDEELKAYLLIMALATVLITINVLPLFDSAGTALQQAAFQVSSIMTTTGYVTTDFNTWPELSRSILVLLMIVGASAGSTGGGIKVARLVISIKSAKKEIGRMLHPREVRVLHMSGKALDNRTVKGVNVFLGVYFFIVAISFLLVSLDNKSMVTNITAVLSCVNNIGPGLDLVGPTGNFSSFSVLSKLVLTIDMLLGRLEIFPLLILFIPSAWKHRRRAAIPGDGA